MPTESSQSHWTISEQANVEAVAEPPLRVFEIGDHSSSRTPGHPAAHQFSKTEQADRNDHFERPDRAHKRTGWTWLSNHCPRPEVMKQVAKADARRRIGILSPCGTGNLGDEATVAVLIQEIARRYP